MVDLDAFTLCSCLPCFFFLIKLILVSRLSSAERGFLFSVTYEIKPTVPCVQMCLVFNPHPLPMLNPFFFFFILPNESFVDFCVFISYSLFF